MARVAALLLLLCPLAAPALTPAAQARLLPPRGYNPCNGLQCNMGLLGEAALLALAESIVSTGLAAANFSWFNLDDGIISHRDPVTQQLVADTAAFPSGTLQPLAAAVGALGLSLGAYTDRGDRTCEGRPGAQGFEAQDAATWASWGVRWLKEDSCASSGDFSVAAQQYGAMAAGLRATGQDVFFSLCGWFSGFAAFSALSPTIGDAWRVGTDVPNFERFLQNIESADAAAAFSGPSKGWPDIDMIGGHWPAQQETLHLAFIALIGAPLLLSWNVSDPGASTLPLSAYLNPELLALHSDDPAPAVAARGRYYARLAGGAVTGSASARYTGLPLDTATPCADARAAFAFTPAAPGSATGALASLAAPGLCLGAWDTWAGACIDALAVQLVPCGSTANGCDARAQQWTHNASSLLLASALDWGGGTPRPGPYLSHVGAVPGALYLQSASAAPPPPPAAAPPLAQAWQWLPLGGASGGNASSVALQGADGQCLGSPLGGDSASGANVWARWLANGDVALLLFNAGLSPADAICDAACLGAALGAAGHAQWRARDVWRRADAGVVTVAEGVRAAGLAAQGGTLLLRLTPLQ
jgi:alpha-galactosidase